MTRFHVGPDGTRYKVIPNMLPDPQDYGHVEPVADTVTEREDRIQQAKVTLAWHERQGEPTEGAELVAWELAGEVVALAAELEAAKPGPCLNCGSREQTVVCSACGRLNPAEETP